VEKPHRRFELSINVSADNIADLREYLGRVIDEVSEKDHTYASATGGKHGSATVKLVEDPEMTGERYFHDLDLYIAKVTS
jgi:hypothetical protein